MGDKSLEWCVDALKRYYERVDNPTIEATLFGVNNLRDHNDILEFVAVYETIMRGRIAAQSAQDWVRRFVGNGYNVDDIALLQVHDNFYGILGNIFNQDTLEPWYAALESQYGEGMEEKFAEMRRT